MASLVSKLYSPLKIPLENISKATNNFAYENLIGKGAFGNVYRGKLWWSEQWIDISARRFDRKYGLGDVEFWAEIQRLSILEHRNIVSIIGFCDEKDEKHGREVKIIINKHETKGSLQTFLSGSYLTWMQRLRICVGVAHALRYLHNSGVVHHNINTSSILLDKNREVKLSGFEFSIQNPSTRGDRVHLTEIGGVIGYVDPEYEKTGGITYKSDVFSFGVVLFEILSGRKAYHDDTFLDQVARLHYDTNKVHEIVNPELWKVIDAKTFLVFSEIAYSCLKEQRANRPSMDEILNKLEKAYNHQLKLEIPAQSTVAAQLTPSNYWEEKHLEHLKIPLKDIELATENFSNTYCIGSGGFAMVYKAKLDYFDSNSFSPIEWKNVDELPKRNGNVSIKRIFKRDDDQGETVFFREIEMLGICKHHNIVSLLGFCDEGAEMIIVCEYASKGSLDDYLESTSNLSWALRLKICLDVAYGLHYLHNNTEDKQRIIHRDIKSANIVFGNNWEAKISDFGLSMILPSDQIDNTLYLDVIAGTKSYFDPEYMKTGKLRIESDTYSFGVVLFEIMCGRLAYDSIYMEENETGLASIVRRCFDDGTLREMVDPKIMEEIDLNIFNQNRGPNPDSLDTFLKVAYQCLAETQVERPSMKVIIKELEKALHFQENRTISFEEIKSATKNFNRDNYIGGGGSAMVYKGEVQHPNGCNTIVAKMLKKNHHGQGKHQFLTECQILREYKHENIIGLIGYCDQTDENIIVYEHMSNGSLDKHLTNANLTWTKRLQVCIDVACGLDFLHEGGVTQEMVIHRDIKSANILLRDDWKAKIADFGLSLICPINKEADFVVNNLVWGTRGYLDPQYKESGLLTKESDMYSFGVVLFEILSGRFAYKKVKEMILTTLVKHKYHEGKLDQIVFEGIKEQVALVPLTIFCRIAYQCLHDEREKRPTANEVLMQLKEVWKFQVNSDNYKMSLEDLKSATQDFNSERYIAGGRSGKVYRGEVPNLNRVNFIAVKRFHECVGGQQDFLTELEILFKYKHQNVIGVVGYSDEMGEKIIVYEYAFRGSLNRYLKDSHLSWMTRLEICIDAATGLDFIHGGYKAQEGVIHRDIKSSNILLDHYWIAKITGFGLPFVGADTDLVVNHVRNTLAYYDPYIESGLSTKESDIYSFGVVLFEMLSGKLAYENDDEPLARLVKHSFEEGRLDEVVFEGIKGQITPISLAIFQMIACQCLHDERGKRPTAREVVRQLKKALKFQGKQLEHLIKIPLEDILLATENFSSNYCIESEGFYMVYKAELNHFDCNSLSAIEWRNYGELLHKRSNIVSIKRILVNRQEGNGEELFFADIENLSRCRHHNIINLLGFCKEGTELIIVHEYASKGSLADCLSSTDHMTNLPWERRLKICLDIAHGLYYIHSSTEQKQVMIHSNIKSSNILLSDNWEAKITNFEFSKILPPNQQDNALYLDTISGTRTYIDPVYVMTGMLSTASDIYSLGVVLFEIYSGRFAYDEIYQVENDNGIAFTARRCFDEGKLEELVDPKIKEQIDFNMSNLHKGLNQDSLDIFSKVAYQCLAETQAERPKIAVVIKELEKALHLLQNRTISLEDIKLSTKNFSDENCIGIGG